MNKQNTLDIASGVVLIVGIAVAVAAAMKGVLVLALGAGAAVLLMGFIRLRRISDRSP
jgi:4-amino-4-deoxy-L-arabinose transferase-like glycosyltransferase